MKKEQPNGMTPMLDYQIDNLDLQILAILLEDANRPYTSIAQELNVSSGTIHVRMKKLTKVGLVTGVNLAVNVRKLGYDIVAFIGIVLEKSTDYSQILDAMKKIPEIVEVNHITGIYCLLVKVVCRDSAHLLRVLRDQIQPIKGVGFTETFILLEEGVQRPIQLELPD